MSFSIIKKVLKGNAIYWERIPGQATSNGQPAYKVPVGIKCRWDDSIEEVVTSAGRTVFSKAAIMVDRDLVVGSLLQKGLISADTPMIPPSDGTGAHEVIAMKTTPTINQTKFFRQVWV